MGPSAFLAKPFTYSGQPLMALSLAFCADKVSIGANPRSELHGPILRVVKQHAIGGVAEEKRRAILAEMESGDRGLDPDPIFNLERFGINDEQRARIAAGDERLAVWRDGYGEAAERAEGVSGGGEERREDGTADNEKTAHILGINAGTDAAPISR